MTSRSSTVTATGEDGLLPVMLMPADQAGATATASAPTERVHPERARDQDRVLQGHVREKGDGPVTVRESGVGR
ncbi:hypothetical protein ACWDGI_38665 [Streptomyces sp. NPDC001220]